MSEICIGGMVLETNMSEILVHVDAQTKVEKSESSPTSTIKVNRIHNDMIVEPITLSDVSTLVGGGGWY